MVQEESCKTPEMTSPEWNEFVLSHFTEDELFESLPKVDGLRRVAKLLLGGIKSSKPVQVFPVNGDGPGRATVVYEVVFSDGSVWGEVADVWVGNTDSMYLAYAVATASTRAEGRALRKALGLKTLCAEEMPNNVNPEKVVAENSETLIQKDQIEFIDMKCKKMDINVVKFINKGKNQYNSIYNVTKEAAAQMIKVLRSFQDKLSVPDDDIKGYDKDWRK